MPETLPTVEPATTPAQDRIADLDALLASIAERERRLGLPPLTEEEADELADQLVHEAIDSLVEQGKLVFERDLRSPQP